MIDSKRITEALLEEYRKGKTYQEIAQGGGLSYSYLHEIINGKRSADCITIKKLNSLFPDCVLQLFGDKTKISVRENSGNVVGVNHGTVGGCLDWAMDKILAADELSADEKIKVLKVLKK